VNTRAEPGPAPAGVVLIDADRLVREGLRAILVREGFPVLADVASLRAGESVLRTTAAAAVLLDPDLPGVDRGGACRRIVAAGSAPVIVLSNRCDAGSVRGALDAGVRGYLVKRSGLETELAAVLRRVIAGKIVLDRRAIAILRDEGRPGVGLSPREREVLMLVADGLSNAEIGRRLHLSRHTVKEYLSVAMRKLGVATRVEAALTATRLGLLTGESVGERRAGWIEAPGSFTVAAATPAVDEGDIRIPRIKLRGP
jgi:DNA-binding NarL/FixJ family response regulator